MATVSERARGVIGKIGGMGCDCEALFCAHVSELIEQALLAERRLAMEEAAKIAEECTIDDTRDERFRIASTLRAAAEKEVSK